MQNKSQENWTTVTGEKIPLSELTHQHISNIYWFLKVICNSEENMITDAITKFFKGVILEYIPSSAPEYFFEHIALFRKGFLVGNDIIFNGEKIGHIKK